MGDLARRGAQARRPPRPRRDRRPASAQSWRSVLAVLRLLLAAHADRLISRSAAARASSVMVWPASMRAISSRRRSPSSTSDPRRHGLAFGPAQRLLGDQHMLVGDRRHLRAHGSRPAPARGSRVAPAARRPRRRWRRRRRHRPHRRPGSAPSRVPRAPLSARGSRARARRPRRPSSKVQARCRGWCAHGRHTRSMPWGPPSSMPTVSTLVKSAALSSLSGASSAPTSASSREAASLPGLAQTQGGGFIGVPRGGRGSGELPKPGLALVERGELGFEPGDQSRQIVDGNLVLAGERAEREQALLGALQLAWLEGDRGHAPRRSWRGRRWSRPARARAPRPRVRAASGQAPPGARAGAAPQRDARRRFPRLAAHRAPRRARRRSSRRASSTGGERPKPLPRPPGDRALQAHPVHG